LQASHVQEFERARLVWAGSRWTLWAGSLVISDFTYRVRFDARPDKATDRRVQILEAAAQEFADGGLRGASIETIARAAGITQPYVFRLFGSKKALFLEVVAGSFTQLADSMRVASRDETGLDALAAMGARYNALLADRTALQLQAT
jgi:AcrR family transcriptional regulator